MKNYSKSLAKFVFIAFLTCMSLCLVSNTFAKEAKQEAIFDGGEELDGEEKTNSEFTHEYEAYDDSDDVRYKGTPGEDVNSELFGDRSSSRYDIATILSTMHQIRDDESVGEYYLVYNGEIYLGQFNYSGLIKELIRREKEAKERGTMKFISRSEK